MTKNDIISEDETCKQDVLILERKETYQICKPSSQTKFELPISTKDEWILFKFQTDDAATSGTGFELKISYEKPAFKVLDECSYFGQSLDMASMPQDEYAIIRYPEVSGTNYTHGT